MAWQSKYTMAVATFAIALGAGYIMQNTDQLSQLFGSAPELEPQHVQLASATLPLTTTSDATLSGDHLAIPSPPAAVFSPVPRLPNAGGVARGADAPVTLPRTEQVEHSPFGLPCDLTISAIPTGGATAELSLVAPCQLNARAEVSYSGLTFAEQTSNTGQLQISLPMLDASSEVTVSFADNTSHTAVVALDDLDEYDRVALVWQGRSALHIHALEFGAEYGGAGHVWSDAPRSASHATSARGGYLTLLGDPNLDPPMVAEVYSFPNADATRNGTVRLSVEAEVTPYSCGQDIEARTVQLSAEQGLQWLDLTLAMPDCDAVGDFLVLNNLLQDLRIARN